jgi:hypothetical protein
MYGIPSGPYYTPELIANPKLRPGRRVRVIPNEESVFYDMVGREGTLVSRNGSGYLVYFDDYIDLNAPLSVLEFLPDIKQNTHLFSDRLGKESCVPYELNV